ncbi:MAG: sel1 repeat family protein [Alphaproteobacteria bacterium]|nr:sel1 repeat family protein [Alphaproteobacteria bacterium]
MKRFSLSVALSAFLLSSTAFAGLTEALTAYKINRYEQAFAEFSYLADEGDATAYYYLGKMYAKGEGVPKDLAMAVEYYKKAESAYNIDAAYELAQILLDDAVDPSDPKFETGLGYLKRAAYAGQADALYQLGELFAEGKKVEKSYQNSFGYYLMSALRGHAGAQFKLAAHYYNGLGTPQDYENALKWLSRSARQGYVLAQSKLADLRASKGPLSNVGDAYAWYSIIAAYNAEDEIGREAAKKRNEVANRIKKKEMIMQMQRRAREWRPISAEKSVPKNDLLLIPTPVINGFNDPESIQNMLAQGEVLLTDGRKYSISPDMIVEASISKDMSEIEKKVNASVKKGEISAYAYYGDLLRSRFQNDGLAVVWYRKGAEGGDPYAQYQLAKCYCEGKGMDAARPSQCYAWLKVAQDNSKDTLNLTIQNALNIIDAEMDANERKQGEEIYEDLKKKTQEAVTKKDLLNGLF